MAGKSPVTATPEQMAGLEAKAGGPDRAGGDRAEALKPTLWPGPGPGKAQVSLARAEPLLSAPVTNRVNWTLARLADEIAAREGVTISKSQLSKALRKKGAFAIADPATR